ncbi:glycosyltransferase [Senegalia sp. (in: firmicutes)]|uniref:glycosyltransferase n=1 Tax=Senegalia sp. (in: firmicutes) TaxID=1924098 RepID=UPI003F9ADEE5
MRELNIYYSMTFYKYDSKYYCNGAFGRFLDSLAKEYDHITVCVPVNRDIKSLKLDYQIKSNNIKFQELPNYRNMIGSIRYMFASIKKLIRFSKTWTNVYIRWPSPYSYIVYLLSKIRNTPTTVHLVGDTKAIVMKGNKYEGVIKLAAILLANHQEWVLKKIMKKSKVIANGSGLRRLYSKNSSKVKEIRTSTFMEKEIYSRYDSCEKETLKLLYVGYLRHEKGIQYLINAIKMIINKNLQQDIYLYLVGDGEEKEKLKTLVKEKGLEKRIIFKGYVPLGEMLFEIYRESDIFILPSISEGTPRVLIEAMANGMPVIATDVGGIPYTIKDGYNGLLIKPEESNELFTAITRVILDRELRKKLIYNGYKFAYENTLEAHINELVEWVEAKKCVEKN